MILSAILSQLVLLQASDLYSQLRNDTNDTTMPLPDLSHSLNSTSSDLIEACRSAINDSRARIDSVNITELEVGFWEAHLSLSHAEAALQICDLLDSVELASLWDDSLKSRYIDIRVRLTPLILADCESRLSEVVHELIDNDDPIKVVSLLSRAEDIKELCEDIELLSVDSSDTFMVGNTAEWMEISNVFDLMKLIKEGTLLADSNSDLIAATEMRNKSLDEVEERLKKIPSVLAISEKKFIKMFKKGNFAERQDFIEIELEHLQRIGDEINTILNVSRSISHHEPFGVRAGGAHHTAKEISHKFNAIYSIWQQLIED